MTRGPQMMAQVILRQMTTEIDAMQTSVKIDAVRITDIAETRTGLCATIDKKIIN